MLKIVIEEWASGIGYWALEKNYFFVPQSPVPIAPYPQRGPRVPQSPVPNTQYFATLIYGRISPIVVGIAS
jgi:hypothetical protein